MPDAELHPLRTTSFVRVLVVCLLSLTFMYCASKAQSQQQSNSSEPSEVQNTSAQTKEAALAKSSLEAVPRNPEPLVLREATPVKLKLLHPLNSKTVVEGDPLNFALAEEVLLGGSVVAAVGTVAIGRVQHAKAARMLGRGGELLLEMQYLKVGRVRVPLRGSQARSGKGKTADTVALVALFGLSGLVKHGSEVEIKEGSVFTAYVDQDTKLNPGTEGGTPAH